MLVRTLWEQQAVHDNDDVNSCHGLNLIDSAMSRIHGSLQNLNVISIKKLS